jgi:hypothetical protein
MVVPSGGVAEWFRQGPAKPCTPVRFRSPPPMKALVRRVLSCVARLGQGSHPSYVRAVEVNATTTTGGSSLSAAAMPSPWPASSNAFPTRCPPGWTTWASGPVTERSSRHGARSMLTHQVAEDASSPHTSLCLQGRLGRRAVRSSALRRMGVVAVAAATTDLLISPSLLLDDVLGPLAPSGLGSGRLSSRLRWKHLAQSGGTFATVGPTPAVGDSVNGRLLRQAEPLSGKCSGAEILPL